MQNLLLTQKLKKTIFSVSRKKSHFSDFVASRGGVTGLNPIHRPENLSSEPMSCRQEVIYCVTGKLAYCYTKVCMVSQGLTPHGGAVG